MMQSIRLTRVLATKNVLTASRFLSSVGEPGRRAGVSVLNVTTFIRFIEISL
jgi:hypothetical protein